MRITETALSGVKIIEPAYFEDYRGYYTESYSARTMAENGISTVFAQDNHSFTLKEGTIRAIHFQNNPKPQIKLVRCTKGVIWDIAVDLRKNSPNYKKWISVILSAENRKQILIPSGFGHGFLTLCDNCEVLYKVDNFYEPHLDRAIKWNDSDINIQWPIKEPIVSIKDISAPSLLDSDVNFTMEENT
ncbi:MAG: dTDP-4-dehydrorhamnose 3,5-epimerase [Firmicutes bacterium]|nr:dTDP-4-dehydrorhamnose 3,5-epimerase [Bacillota bacterium]